MKTRMIMAVLFMALSNMAYSNPVLLDFTSGEYNVGNWLYSEDGFTVTASKQFHNIRLGTLAWYDADNIITVMADDGAFSLENLNISNPAYSGLIFESSKGGAVKVGSATKYLSFSGEDWSGIDYFTIATVLKNFDILNQIDNISVSIDQAAVPEPPTTMLLVAGIFVIFLLKIRREKKQWSKICC